MSALTKLFLLNQFSKGFFTPDLISNLTFWLDAADSSTITTSGSNVTQWVDKSITATALTQPNVPKQGVLTMAAQNGLDVIDFTSLQYMGNTTVNAIATFGATGDMFTVFLVAKKSSSTLDLTFNYNHVLNLSGGINGNSSNSAIILTQPSSPASDSLLFRSPLLGGALTSSPQAGLIGSFHAITGVRNGVSADVLADNVNVGTIGTLTATPTQYTNHVLAVGHHPTSAAGGTVSVAEVVIYDRVLSASEITQVNQYFITKWNL